MDIPELPSVDAPPASVDAPRGGGDTAETPQRRIDAQHHQAPPNQVCGRASGGAESVLVFAVVGAILGGDDDAPPPATIDVAARNS